MTQRGKQSGSAHAVAQRVKDVRTKRGLTAAALAERMTDLGIRWDRSIVANLESGRRRTVSIEELLALALALNVAPVHLLVPVDDPGEAYEVVPSMSSSRFSVRAWVRGVGTIDPDADDREFYSEVPREEFYLPAHKSSDGSQVGAVQQGPSHGGYTGVVQQPADEG